MTDEKRSRVLGMILGSVSRGQFPQRSPVAFLYNGVRLPKLPELPADDVEKYPHLFISNTGLQMVAIRWASMPVVKTSGGYGNLDGVAEYLRCSYDNFGGNEWGTWEEGAISAVNSVVAPFYGNVDLYTEDGKLYLQGTNPVPVYE